MELEIEHCNPRELQEDIIRDLIRSAEIDKVPFKIKGNPADEQPLQFAECLKAHESYVAFADYAPVGVVNFLKTQNSIGEKGAEIFYLYVKSFYRGRGIGYRLFLRAIGDIKQYGSKRVNIEPSEYSNDAPFSKIVRKVLGANLKVGRNLDIPIP